MKILTFIIRIPHRVAYPGQWWRVTCIALILCGASPEKIGSSMWEMHPTLQSLIKMTVSGKYRFPTADCNESEKEEMKKNESNIRDQVSTKNLQILLGCHDTKRDNLNENVNSMGTGA